MSKEDEDEREWWPVWPLLVMIVIFVSPILVYGHHTRWSFHSYGMDGAVPLLIGVFLIWPIFGLGIVGYSLGLTASIASYAIARRRRRAASKTLLIRRCAVWPETTRGTDHGECVVDKVDASGLGSPDDDEASGEHHEQNGQGYRRGDCDRSGGDDRRLR